ncbi:MAG: DUF4255 domain-containing protein [Deferribacteres bacterium]|nr:DUF4255 domain-containing protein [candidate division KSB1 bacterium]MCB9500649.1 DUF4255 domain-containing protein [Deferribacteres bacterium]
MIGETLETLCKEIQHYFVTLPELHVGTEEAIVLSNIFNGEGKFAVSEGLSLSIINIEEERVVKSQQSAFKMPNGNVVHMNPEIKLNLYFIIAANFENYKTGLQFLSAAVRFFQARNVFTRQNTPNLPEEVEKLIVEFFSINFEQQNHLWSVLGAKYLPSVVYRARLLTIQEGLVRDNQPAFSQLEIPEISL